MNAAERRAAHKICSTTPLMDDGFEAADTALEQAYAILSIMQLAATDTGAEFGLMNSRILDRAFDGVQHLVAEAHFQLWEMRGQRSE
jgi:hypothetical protein